MSFLRRVFVLACIVGGGWLAWGEEAPEGAEWLQPVLDAVQQTFDEVELQSRLGRAFVGAGAGALAAFLLCGGLWRPLRFFAMVLLVGAGAGGGRYLATEAQTDWLVREFGIEGVVPTMLMCGAAAALLLGVFDLLRPSPARDETSASRVSVFRLLFVPAFVVAMGWLAWGEEAPAEAEWLQPTLDHIQDAFGRIPLEPRWARALAGGGAAGLVAFLLGGALWKPGRFVAMLVVLGAGAAAGWSLTTDPLSEWTSQNVGELGLVPAIVLGVSGAGLLLGLVEWLRPVSGVAAAEEGATARGAYSGKLGLYVPPGRFTAQLTSSSDEEYDRAVNEIEAVTQKGDRSGLDEIEAIIKANAPRGAKIEYHQPGLRMFAGRFDADKVIAQFLIYAKGKGVLAHAKEIQLEMSQLAMFGRLPDAMVAIQQAAGAKERRCFQLLYEQLRVTAMYLKAK